jgi:hypothetical protein
MVSMIEPQRAGVLVVSLWVEGSGQTIRARVTETSDINAVGELTNVVGSIEELLKAVETWATTFIGPDPDAVDRSDSRLGEKPAIATQPPAAGSPAWVDSTVRAANDLVTDGPNHRQD